MEVRGLIVSIIMLGIAGIITGVVVLPMIIGVNTTTWDDSVVNLWNVIPLFFVLALMLGIVGLFTYLVA